MNSYTFPFNSCEKPQHNSQPYSTAVTLGICAIVFYFLLIANTFSSRLFIFALLIFNLFHTSSHYMHIENAKNIQFLLTHFSAIFASLTLVYLLYCKTNHPPPNLYLLTALYLFDIFLISMNYPHIVNIITFVIILVYIIATYYRHFSRQIQEKCRLIAAATILTLIIQLLEIKYCHTLLQLLPNFPFHILVEIVGGVAIYLLCSLALLKMN